MRTTASKLFSVLRDKLVTVQHVEIEDKDTYEISTMPADQFIDNLDFYNAAGILSDTTDVLYELNSSTMEVRLGYHNPYSNVGVKATLQIPGSTDTAILRSQLKIE